MLVRAIGPTADSIISATTSLTIDGPAEVLRLCIELFTSTPLMGAIFGSIMAAVRKRMSVHVTVHSMPLSKLLLL